MVYFAKLYNIEISCLEKNGLNGKQIFLYMSDFNCRTIITKDSTYLLVTNNSWTTLNLELFCHVYYIVSCL